MVKLSTAEIIESLKGMTILELNELVKAIEEEFGVTAAQPVATVQGVEEESVKTEYDVIITHPGAAKIGVIKAIRELTGLGLKEAKDLVDNVPKAVKEKVSEEEANIIKEKLVEVGATVEIK